MGIHERGVLDIHAVARDEQVEDLPRVVTIYPSSWCPLLSNRREPRFILQHNSISTYDESGERHVHPRKR